MVASLTPLGLANAASDNRQSMKRSRDRAEEYTAMLVRDWLERSALRTTLQTFDEECARLDRGVPGVSEWAELVELLQPACLVAARRDSAATKTRAATPLLRLLVMSLLREQTPLPSTGNSFRLPRQQSTIIMTKRNPASDALNTSIKRQLPRAAAPETTGRLLAISNNARKAGLGSPSSLRPKSAMVCRSMAELMSQASGECARLQIDQTTSTSTLKKPPRPISAASVLVNRRGNCSPDKKPSSKTASDSTESKSPQTDKMMTRVSCLKAIVPPSARHSSTVSVASLPQISEANGATGGEDCDDDHPQESVPALLLEEMSEELLMSQFSSLSKEAIKTIRRVRAKSNAYNQEFEKAKRTIDKIQAREKQRQLRRVLAAEQTELLSCAMDGLTKEPCTLCQHVFPKKSLVMKVTYKAIFDLRASWAAVANVDNQHSRHINNSLEALQTPKPTAEGGDDNDFEDRSHVAHFYDEVPICVFCKQLVLNVSLYRPSSAEIRAKRVEAAKAAAKMHQQESERSRAFSRCDPLDFDSYLFNSDEDDSDTEEVLEYDADGRQHIVRRKKLQKVKVVANRGLVGKHLHYDKLRSESVHALNNKEWQQITS